MAGWPGGWAAGWLGGWVAGWPSGWEARAPPPPPPPPHPLPTTDRNTPIESPHPTNVQLQMLLLSISTSNCPQSQIYTIRIEIYTPRHLFKEHLRLQLLIPRHVTQHMGWHCTRDGMNKTPGGAAHCRVVCLLLVSVLVCFRFLLNLLPPCITFPAPVYSMIFCLRLFCTAVLCHL